MYKYVNFEASGGCNASCPYCLTGKNRVIPQSTPIEKSHFLTPQVCEETLRCLEKKELICPKTSIISFFNWGEPFLNPQLSEVLTVAADMGYTLGLSTNASIYRDIPSETLKKIRFVIFSMSGMKQSSYGRNHGFDVEKIKSNIRLFYREWKEKGHVPNLTLFFHLYQYNWFEIFEASAFCGEMNISFAPMYASFGHHELVKQYFNNTLSNEIRERVQSELFTFFYPKTPSLVRPADYNCPLVNILSIDEKGCITLCCGTDKSLEGFEIGLAKDLSKENIISRHKNSQICRECQSHGFDYLGELTPKVSRNYFSILPT